MKRLIDLYIKVFHFWMRFPEKVRFLLVGGYNTVFSYLIYALFLYMSNGTQPQIALALSFLLSSINSYLTQKIYVFNTRSNYISEYIRCLGTWSVGYLINTVLLWFFISYLEINPYVAQLLISIIISVNSYVLLKYFAFQKGKKDI